jgi:hypothetical protein
MKESLRRILDMARGSTNGLVESSQERNMKDSGRMIRWRGKEKENI